MLSFTSAAYILFLQISASLSPRRRIGDLSNRVDASAAQRTALRDQGELTDRHRKTAEAAAPYQRAWRILLHQQGVPYRGLNRALHRRVEDVNADINALVADEGSRSSD